MHSIQSRQSSSFDELSQVIRLVKDRQEKFLELLNFLKKNINSHSQQINQLAIFSIFIKASEQHSKSMEQQQIKLITKFSEPIQAVITTQTVKKDVFRLCARIMEIVDYSHARSQDYIVYSMSFNFQHKKFKKEMSIIISADKIHIPFFLQNLFNHLKSKYNKEIQRVKSYIASIEQGEDISLKQMYQIKHKPITNDEDQIFMNRTKIKNISLRKNSKVKNKQKSTTKSYQLSQQEEIVSTIIPKPPKNIQSAKQLKQKVVYKQLKNYNIMKLNKQQFLDDFLFDKAQIEQQEKSIYNNLIQKNKANKSQINDFYRRVQSVPNINKFIEKQMEEIKLAKLEIKQRSPNIKNDANIRNNFIISRNRFRKDHLMTNEKKNISNARETISHRNNSEIRRFSKANATINGPQQTILTTFTEQGHDQQLSKLTLRETPKQKRIYVIKNPIVFQDQALLKTQQIPIRKYEPIKAKRKSHDHTSKFIDRKQTIVLTQRPTVFSFYK